MYLRQFITAAERAVIELQVAADLHASDAALASHFASVSLRVAHAIRQQLYLDTAQAASTYLGPIGEYLMLAVVVHATTIDAEHTAICPTRRAIGNGTVAVMGARQCLLTTHAPLISGICLGGMGELWCQFDSVWQTLTVTLSEPVKASLANARTGATQTVTFVAGSPTNGPQEAPVH